MAGGSRAPDWLTARPFAHRGLHDGNRSVLENSINAAEAAIAAGFGIECDVQLSADGIPHVFHDDDLARLTGQAGDIRKMASQALTACLLADTDEPIPTLAHLLAVVAGRVPLLVELKGRSPEEDRDFVPALVEAILLYRGPLALMSFDAWLVDSCLALVADRPVGLTAQGREEAMLARHERVATKGCAFVSYDHRTLDNRFVRGFRDGGGAILCWTIRSAEEAASVAPLVDQITFEGYTPPL